MEINRTSNRLADEKSPYLKQHAANPVDWYPWGAAAWNAAKSMNRPIFLSIGYSTCHWCHVMAHESFENKKIAEILNNDFISIKVDREERPDVDAIYMTAVQALTGSGGWPMSVWLTPELKPFFAGTYFPPEDRYGRPGFPSVLEQIAAMWKSDRPRILESANQITELLTQFSGQSDRADGASLDFQGLAENVFRTIQSQFDSVNGGFGSAPKFPMPVYLEFLLDHYRRTKNEPALAMAALTMEKISQGGIYDHLGGGFARYSTDEKWIVPHFEKMLYDNAQLISVAARLYEGTGDETWNQLTRHAIRYVLRDLTHPDGAFYSAEDADSEGKEGAFYLWTLHEIKSALPTDEADAFIARYGVTAQGNFIDPHTRESGQNVLVKTGPVTDPQALAFAEKRLLEVRERRPRPHRDEKVITEWNGLMISALATAGRCLKDKFFIEAASKAADFIRAALYDATSQRLYRSWCDGQRGVEGQQVDYAMLIQGLLDLSEVSNVDGWREWALELQQAQDRLFFDPELGGYFMNVARPDLLIRMKDDNDNVIPSGNSVAVGNGFRLSGLTGKREIADAARKTAHAFSTRLKSHPASMATLVSTLAENAGQL